MQPQILSVKETGLLGGNDKQNIAQDRGGSAWFQSFKGKGPSHTFLEDYKLKPIPVMLDLKMHLHVKEFLDINLYLVLFYIENDMYFSHAQ